MHETSSLKVLAYKALERLEKNKPRNKIETKEFKVVSAPILCETQNIALSKPFLPERAFLSETYDERIAIAEYDGQQTPTQAQRIAYQDAFIAVLNTLPYEENYGNNWLEQRIKVAQAWLTAQGLHQPD
ncbi:MAG TPA: hypothetical protein VMW10_06145 [Alphaproteobacteria bacterium]|nr:hypothetical protein [Alphaproteobacteria bacterium]